MVEYRGFHLRASKNWVAGSSPVRHTNLRHTMSKEYCDCGTILEFFDSEWAKYPYSDGEEIITIYVCPKCKRKWSKREGNFPLEEVT